MTVPSLIRFMYECPGRIISGDGFTCVAKAEPINMVIFIAIIVAVVIYIKKKKGKRKINKSFGSFIGE